MHVKTTLDVSVDIDLVDYCLTYVPPLLKNYIAPWIFLKIQISKYIFIYKWAKNFNR